MVAQRTANSEKERLCVVILAAGRGRRLHSSQPKALLKLAGRPLLGHLLAAVENLPKARTVVVVAAGQKARFESLKLPAVEYIEQAQPLGSGDAVAAVLPWLNDIERVLVLCVDVPLLSSVSLQRLLRALPPQGGAVLSTRLTQPEGFGRLLRDRKGHLLAIVEQRDANVEQCAIDEVNSGAISFALNPLRQLLPQLKNNNAQREYYLTDLISLAVANGIPVIGECDPDACVVGINDRLQWAQVERLYQQQQAQRLMRQGLQISDPARFDLRGELSFGPDCSIDVNCLLEGHLCLGAGVTVAANCVLRDVEIGDGVDIQPFSMIDGAHIGDRCRIGPFARIRPATNLADEVHIGNFVELKNSHMQRGSKANHLSYLGDSEIGAESNIGAGVVACNYDGQKKSQTHIGERAFIGSNSSLVAPLTIGADSLIGAGSTITRDVPAGHLALARGRQRQGRRRS